MNTKWKHGAGAFLSPCFGRPERRLSTHRVNRAHPCSSVGKFFCLGSVLFLFAGPLFAEVVFHYRFEPGGLGKDEENAHALTATAGASGVANTSFPAPLPQSGHANEGAVDLNGSGHLSAQDSPQFTSNEFSLELFFEADSFHPAYVDTLVSHYHFSGTNDRSWMVHESNGRLAVTLSEDGLERYTFLSGLQIQVGTPYAALLRVRIDSQEGARVQWSWRNLEEGGDPVTEGVQLEPQLTALHNSSSPLRVGAVTKAGIADNFWDGQVDEVRLHRVWIQEEHWIAREGPMAFSVYMDQYFPGEVDPAIVGLNADPDGDGADNEREYVWGTSPDDAANPGRPRLIGTGSDEWSLRFRRLKHLNPSRLKFRYRSTLLETGILLGAVPIERTPEAGTPDSHEEVELFLSSP